MNETKILKLITAILETVLAVPVFGGLLIVSLLWTPLFAMLVLHIIALVFCIKYNKLYAGNVIGIIASVIGWIPILGMVLHIISAIVLWVEFVKLK